MSLAIAGCNGSNAPAGAPQVLMPATTGQVAFQTVAATKPGSQLLVLTCADCDNGTVYFYRGNHPGGPIKSMLVDNAFAVAVDDSQNLYVSGGGRNSPTLITEEYTLGGSFEYHDMVNNPTNVAPLAGSAPGFYVANGPQELVFPTPGIDQSQVVQDSNFGNILTTAADSVGDVYIGGTTPNGAFEVDLIMPNETPVKLPLKLTGLPVALELDKRGNLIVDERTIGVAVFAPGRSSPIHWFDNAVGQHPVSAVLGGLGERLYVLDNATVYAYAYPTGTLQWEYSVPHSLSCCTAQIAIDPRFPLFNPGAANGRSWTDFVRSK